MNKQEIDSDKTLFKLYIRNSHMVSFLSGKYKDIREAHKAFKRWYKVRGVNVDDMKTYVVAPCTDEGCAIFDLADGWDGEHIYTPKASEE